MKRRTIKVIATFDMSDIPIDRISPKEKVKEMTIREVEEELGWEFDEGYLGVEVAIIDE